MARAKKNYNSGHELIKARRAELGYSLRKLGDMTGIDPTHLMHIEKGKKVPSMERGLRILEALSIPIKDYMKAIGYPDVKKGKGDMVAVQGLEPRTLRI